MANQHRLPQHITPERYKILIKPDLEKFTFNGEETISLKIDKPTKTVTLHSAELEILSAQIEDQSGIISYDVQGETATLTFSHTISAGKKQLQLTFTGVLNDKMRGFYRSKYEINGDPLHMAVTQFESTDARRAFPCFDEPAMKAIFDVTLMIPQDHTAISNTLEETVTEHESGFKLVQFAPTPQMSTYLLAFIVGKFEYIEKKTKEGVLVRVFTTPGKKHQAEFALDAAVKVLSFYNNYFAIDYPLPVLDLIAVPDFAAGAMENWGAVTFRETALLVDPDHSSVGNKQWVALVIAHELAHMWFGDLVTMEWWTHLWLNEGFACFIEYLAVDEIFPEWDIWTQFISTEHNVALQLDGLKNTHPIEVPVKHPSEISEIFDEVSYAKGASVIRMLANYLGKNDFRDGLRYYLKKHAYQNAQTEHLWEAFENISKKPIQKLMQQWTQKPGYPVLTLSEKGKEVTLTQKRFFSSSHSAKANTENTLWTIPLEINIAGKITTHMFDKKTFSLPKPQEWIKINAQEASFVRVQYPKEYLAQLETVIKTKKLGEIDRLGVIRDAFNLAEAGMASTADALALASSYINEDNYTVWMELTSHIHRIASLFYGVDEVYKAYQPYAKNLFAGIAKKMGWQKKEGERHTDALLRSLALYGYGTYGDAETITKAQEMFADFVQHQKHINPDLRGVVYGLVSENGGEKEFNTFLDLYQKEELHQEKDRIARALASFKNKELLSKTLDWSISDAVRSQDAPRILYAVFANERGRDLAWEFVKDHWSFYQEKFAGGHGFSRVIDGADAFTTEEKATELQAFFTAHPTPEAARTVLQVIEQIRANAIWIKRDKTAIANFLSKVL